jgi:hypothetical protein
MIIVIQCAARKRPDVGHLVAADGRLVDFVAHPEIAPRDHDREYARPDDLREDGTSWRQYLVRYNDDPGGNPLRLYPAYKLYVNNVYVRLVDRFGARNVYILSAGWGLIRAGFLTPSYDITFSTSADAYQRRRKADPYNDFCMLPGNTKRDIVFLGGKSYMPLFCSLMDAIRSKKIVFFNSASVPRFGGYTFRHFETNTRTNWHYECANALLDDTISI